jgi:hypothetical protein
MKTSLNRSGFALGITIILGCGGCSAGFAETDEATEQVDGGTPCTALNAETPGLQVGWVDAGRSKAVEVVNKRDVDGALTVTKTTISPVGSKSTELANLVIGANEKLVFEVPALDADESAKATSLHVTANAEFADGMLGWDNVASRLIDDRDLIEDAIKNGAIKDQAIAESTAGKAPQVSGPIVTRELVTKELCIEYPGMFDVGGGEDFFTEGVPRLRPARGLRLRIWNNLGGGVEEEFILNNYGCTGAVSLTAGDKVMQVTTFGAIRGVNFEVQDHLQGDVVQKSSGFGATIAADSSTQTFTFDPSDTPEAAAFNVAQAVGWILDRQWSSGAATLTLIVNHETSDYSANIIRLTPGKAYGKFTIGHEMGHWAMDQLTDFNLGGDDHDALSIETQGTALSEGFGNFFAAMAFNGTTQSGCFYGTKNCDQGLSSGGSCTVSTQSWAAIMEHCFPSGDWKGHSNETDWSRVFWNMRAPNGVGSPTILSWINTANDSTAWTNANVYALLDARANAIGGTLNSRFDANKIVNGINH